MASKPYSAIHLVFGKAVRVRHYPVTVSTENLSRDDPATGSSASGKALKVRLRCKSGDRPDHFRANPASMGELESNPRGPFTALKAA
jgi:hypothetical protein